MEFLFKVSANEFLSVNAKKIEGGKKESVQVPAVKKKSFFTSTQIFETHKEHTSYVPYECNKPGMDLAMPPWIFQITMSKKYSPKKLIFWSNFHLQSHGNLSLLSHLPIWMNLVLQIVSFNQREIFTAI